ncbi:hypothetical protein V5799_019193 [Amblyomma americanum]|uniref:Uncharacterized protein n=1 Tax=Amblyomma americanum TaxID=6943 RepID=A0AAQ4EY49_AMBAM
MRQDSFPRLVSGTGSGGHGQSTGRSNSRGRSGSRDRLSCKGPSSSQGRSSSRGRSGSRGRSSSRGHSSSRKRSASRGRDNTGNKWNIGARPKIEGRSECHQQGSTPPTDKTNVPDDHKRVSFVDKVSHTHPPGRAMFLSAVRLTHPSPQEAAAGRFEAEEPPWGRKALTAGARKTPATPGGTVVCSQAVVWNMHASRIIATGSRHPDQHPMNSTTPNRVQTSKMSQTLLLAWKPW